jgi:hypothetical protein
MKIAVVVLLVIPLSLATSQTSTSTQPDTSAVLSPMQSPTWGERSNAFSDAADVLSSQKLTAAEKDRIRLGIIQLLATENNDKESIADEGESENRSEYRAALIDYVRHMNDERAIPALLGAAMSGGMAIRGVARFGKKALGPTLAQANGKDPDLAEGAFYVIQKMLEMRTVNDPDSHARIKSALRSAIESQAPGIREAAIFAIEYLDDREEFVPLLKEVAEHDPYKIPNQPKWDGTVGDYYILREHAAKLLAKIAAHEPPTIDTHGPPRGRSQTHRRAGAGSPA